MLLPLTEMKAGEKGVISSLAGGMEFRHRVERLGIRPAAAVEMISNNARGACLVAVGETRVAVGFGMAEKIFVEVADG